MKSIFFFDSRSYLKCPLTYLIAGLLFCFGLFAGAKFNLSAGEGIYLNSPYSIGFMLGLLSLSVIFIATVAGAQLLFKEWDTRFDLLLFSTPVSKEEFTMGRFLSFYLVTLTGFLCLSAGFMFGQLLRTGATVQFGFHLVHYVYPFFLFGCINTFFVCSVLSLVTWISNNKLLVSVSGFMLYVLYLIVLLYSSSPFMAQSTPQSLEAQRISALIDPFGLSAYFFESKNFSVAQRNSLLTPLTGSLLINRLCIMGVSVLWLYLAKRWFGLGILRIKRKQRIGVSDIVHVQSVTDPYRTASTHFNLNAQFRAILSVIKIDISYLFKTIPIVIAALLVLFFLGMELYAEIENGIRIPQKYASSGLMASAILENFHMLGVLLVVYFANDLYWRSSLSSFLILERLAVLSPAKMLGHWFSTAALILFFSGLSILLGLLFQMAYRYPSINLDAYWGVFVFSTCPLILLSGFVVLLNRTIPNKYLALGISLIIAILTASPLAGKIISNPLWRIFVKLPVVYSDFNGYGPYMPAFSQRVLFGLMLLILIWVILYFIRTKRIRWPLLTTTAMLCLLAVFFAGSFMDGYKSKDNQQSLAWAANYERQYRIYQSLPQPTVTRVHTKVHLFPSENRYQVEGVYLLKNQTENPLQKILVNVDKDCKVEKAQYFSSMETSSFSGPVNELTLRRPMAPRDSAVFRFVLSYAWKPVNRHQPFNAIIGNGSFMRISRYYPKIGYQADYEVKDEKQREEWNLGAASTLKKLAEPVVDANDFIELDMTVDTEEGQLVAGTGELQSEWKDKGRHYFHFRTREPIPFRFGLSSARYKVKSVLQDSIRINVFYHPKHEENVSHLIRSAKLTLDYCVKNFGRYPYRTVTFAEVSSFTSGFAATAYPATIFMTEDMIFHANIKADKQQDVINELAGHELSHLWWGNNQIAPDDREGATMLTETLAMYTEMMLYKKMYGKVKMMERVTMHQQIYDAEKGFAPSEPLYKVSTGNTHIAYSKGAVVMVQLSELLGEQKVNEALRNFLHTVQQSGKKPVSTDFINELLKVSAGQYDAQIKKMFMGI